MTLRIKKILDSQRGFSLVEVLVALLITGLIGAGAAMSTIQVVNQTSRNTDYTAASRNAMNAIYWISRDAQMSQNVTPGGASGFPLTLSWVEWNNSSHRVVYSIDGDTFVRSHVIDDDDAVETVVAQNINTSSENTTCDYALGVMTLKVTATVGEGAHALNVTKEREITPRPGL